MASVVLHRLVRGKDWLAALLALHKGRIIPRLQRSTARFALERFHTEFHKEIPWMNRFPPFMVSHPAGGRHNDPAKAGREVAVELIWAKISSTVRDRPDARSLRAHRM